MFLRCGDQTQNPYSNVGLTNYLYTCSCKNISLSKWSKGL